MAEDRPNSDSAFARGLRVLAAINELEAATVAAICRSADLPKATVIRLIRTLVGEGYLEPVDSGAGYSVTGKVRDLSRALVGRTNMAQVAQPVLDELCTRLKWPSEFLSRDGSALVIEASNREKAPIRLNLFERRRFPLLGSSVGLAFLSALPEDERETLIDELSATHSIADTRDWSPDAVRELVRATRARGYALWDLTTLAPGMRSLAIAVGSDGAPIGSLSLLHFTEYVPENVIEDELLPELRNAAARIVASLGI